jgi:hypothetical protein
MSCMNSICLNHLEISTSALIGRCLPGIRSRLRNVQTSEPTIRVIWQRLRSGKLYRD